MAINKVIKGSTTLIDVTDVGTTAANVAEGVTFIGNDGVKGVGEMSGAQGTTVGELLSNGGTLLNYQGTTVDLTGADTSSRTNFGEMFRGCYNLMSLDVSDINTSSADTLSYMFADDSALSTIDVTGFDTSNVTSFESMFYGCSGLTSLNVSGFDTSKATMLNGMFANTSSLTSLNVSSFDTSNGVNFSEMFSYSGLTSLDLSNFDTSKAVSGGLTNMLNLGSLTTLKLPARFNEVEDDLGLDNASSLQTIYVPTPALSYYTDASADPHNSYFTDRPDLVNKVVGYTPPTTTYTFVTTGGSAVSPITTADFLQYQSSTADNPDYVLRGWYFDSAFTKKAKFPYLNTNANNTAITLYAKYGEPNPSTKALAIDIGNMVDPYEYVEYELVSTSDPVATSMWATNYRVWFKYTPSGSNKRLEVQPWDANWSVFFTVQNSDDSIYSEGYSWEGTTLIDGNTYYISVGYDAEVLDGTPITLAFAITDE